MECENVLQLFQSAAASDVVARILAAVQCGENQYLHDGDGGQGDSASSTICASCDNVTCLPGDRTFRTGTCGGTNNGFVCHTFAPCTIDGFYFDVGTAACRACSNIACRPGQFRAGACGGVTDGHTCHACDSTTCTDFNTEYRVGVCTGTVNGYTCEPRPACPGHQYLAGAGTATPGECQDRRITSCGAGEYLAGSPMVEGVCTPCANIACGVGTFREGACGSTDNSYACPPCTNTVCTPGSFRVGTCSGTTNGYACVPQPTCAAGHHLADATATSAGSCAPHPVCTGGKSLLGATNVTAGTCSSRGCSGHGAAHADSSMTRLVCDCDVGWAGEDCDDAGPLVGIILGVLFGVALLGAVVYHYHIKPARLARQVAFAASSTRPIAVSLLNGDLMVLRDWGGCRDLRTLLRKQHPDKVGPYDQFELREPASDGTNTDRRIDPTYQSRDRDRFLRSAAPIALVALFVAVHADIRNPRPSQIQNQSEI